MDKIIFKAIIPQIQSAIQVGNDTMRLRLDVPDTELVNALPLLGLRNEVLKVTIELGGDEENLHKEVIPR